MQHLAETNKLVQHCKATRETYILFRSDMQHGGGDIRGVVFADSSFNNVDDITFGELGEKLRSQLGCVRLLTDDGLYGNKKGLVHILDWCSSRSAPGS